ncbi:hypothetical protein PFISCL1PPCAC_4767 [Pristionchus fissidentatus]|uniref:Phosphatase n=1 Tax=Pristionchus fissidentatus TaxID=1538716 RepID=A0AAV5V6K0_9BILA|nr:hypothetical protein PFISCL1PPCAC_4767 [Pristionchus fissidentatus]
MSATAFSLALVGTPLNVETPPTINTTPKGKDQVLAIHDSFSFRCEVFRRHNMTIDPIEPCETRFLKNAIVQEYPDCATFNYTIVEAAITEHADPHVKLDAALEKCARGEGRKVEYRAICIEAGCDTEFSVPRLRDNVGALMDIISKAACDAIKEDTVDETTVKDSVENDVDERKNDSMPIRIYYTHDYNLFAVSQALGVIDEFQTRSPEFSSSLTVETWATRDDYEIRILMKDGVMSPLKAVANFTNHNFKQKIAPYIKESDDILRSEKTVVYPFAEFVDDVGPDLPLIFPFLSHRDFVILSKETARPQSILMLPVMCSLAVTIIIGFRRRRRAYISMD